MLRAIDAETRFGFGIEQPAEPAVVVGRLVLRRIAQQAAATGAAVLLSNHSEFDGAYDKNRMLAGRGDGPHPYEIGAGAVQRGEADTEPAAEI